MTKKQKEKCLRLLFNSLLLKSLSALPDETLNQACEILDCASDKDIKMWIKQCFKKHQRIDT